MRFVPYSLALFTSLSLMMFCSLLLFLLSIFSLHINFKTFWPLHHHKALNIGGLPEMLVRKDLEQDFLEFGSPFPNFTTIPLATTAVRKSNVVCIP